MVLSYLDYLAASDFFSKSSKHVNRLRFLFGVIIYSFNARLPYGHPGLIGLISSVNHVNSKVC